MQPVEIARRIRRPKAPKAFTLVEILIVVVILGILAAMVIPQFVSATTEAKQNSSKMDLHRMRTQLELYQQQHGAWPALATFVDQLTLASKADGSTAASGTAGYNLGPYILEVPTNPMTRSNTVGAGAVGSSDWYYAEATGEFRANDSAESRTW